MEDVINQVQFDEARRLSQPLTDANRVVLVLVKRPLLAMRFQLPDRQVRSCLLIL